MDNLDIEDMFSALGPIAIKRMFGGKGIYHRGHIVAIELRDEMMLKADDVSAPDFAAAGSRQWSYEGRTGKPILMPYWSVPDEAHDDPDVMARFVRLAYSAALRAGDEKKPAKKTSEKSSSPKTKKAGPSKASPSSKKTIKS